MRTCDSPPIHQANLYPNETTKVCDLKIQIDAVISKVNGMLNCTKDNLLCFAVSLQPHFVVWSAAMALHDDLGYRARNITTRNAREEMFGLKDEGSHAVLSQQFFNQLGAYEAKHYNKAKAEIAEIYKHLRNKNAMLVMLTCIELSSAGRMQKILEVMKGYGATDFKYIEIHQSADNLNDGHGVEFLDALNAENPSPSDIELGMSLFENLYVKIFT